MPDETPRDSETSPLLDLLATKIIDKLADPTFLTRLERVGVNFMQQAGPTFIAFLMRWGTEIAVFMAEQIIKGEEQSNESMNRLAATAIRDVFGVQVDPRDMRQGGGAAVGNAVMDAISATGGTLEPSAEPAKKFIGFMTGVALEGWLQGWIVEWLSSMGGLVQGVETFAELDDTLINALGLNRLSRSALRPLVEVTVATPMEWHVNKTFRPARLSPGQVATQVARGRWSREQGIEELARQGFSDDRIEALFNAAAKFHSIADLDLLVRAGQLDRVEAITHLRDAGFDPDVADRELELERLKRIATFERALATSAVNAYADFRIDELALDEATHGVTIDDQEGAQFRELAKARRTFRQRPVSESDAEAAVKAGIWAALDFREYLRREGYTEDAILTRELLLHHEIDKQASIEELRAKAQAERLSEKAKRDQAAAERKAQVEDERRIRRRGPLSLLERAAVRGLIPFSRVEEVLSADYDSDTVAIFLDAIELDRLAYLEQQQRAEEARQRGRRRDLDVGALEAAVLANQLSLGDFARHPVLQAFTAPDRAILVSTLTARKADRDAAVAARAKAEQEAKRRTIDLGRAEQLIIRGTRPMSQYVELLRSLDFDEGSIAAMVELLELKIAEAADARRIRDEQERELATRGLSLEEFRRGVLLGVKTTDEFESFMVHERFSADKQLVLLAQLRDDLQEADAARRQREERERKLGTLPLPLATARRAAQLGVLSPAAYQARLEAVGYRPDDVAIEIELLLLEIADVQARRRRRDALEPDAAGRGLSLAELERAVKAGTAGIADYRARALTLGYATPAVDELVELIERELASQADAARRRDAIDGELVTRDLSLGQLETAVLKGFKSVDHFARDVRALGYGSDDVELLVALLVTKLEGAGG